MAWHISLLQISLIIINSSPCIIIYVYSLRSFRDQLLTIYRFNTVRKTKKVKKNLFLSFFTILRRLSEAYRQIDHVLFILIFIFISRRFQNSNTIIIIILLI